MNVNECWCVKNPEGHLVPYTMSVSKMQTSSHINKNVIDSELYSVVEVELIEKGKHPDTIRLRKIAGWLAWASTPEILRFTDELYKDERLPNDIMDETIKNDEKTLKRN